MLTRLIWLSTLKAERRIDVFLSHVFKDMSRSQLQRDMTMLQKNGKDVKMNDSLRVHDELYVKMSLAVKKSVSFSSEEDLALQILHEDDSCLVISKAQGMPSHPSIGHDSATVVHAIYNKIREYGEDLSYRTGIVHRLDKDTSGVMILAKNLTAKFFLSQQFFNRTVYKQYLAIVKGIPNPLSGDIETYIGRHKHMRKKFTVSKEGQGKYAYTKYHTLATKGNAYALVLFTPHTGRTHQIRVHAAYGGTPILGDPLYARKDSKYADATLMLHAWRLDIRLLSEENTLRTFIAPCPQHFHTLADTIGLCLPKDIPSI